VFRFESSPKRLLPTLLLLSGILWGPLGCGSTPTDKKSDGSGTNELPLKGITLRLGVVDDPALAAEVGRLAAEWQARTGSELTVVGLAMADTARDNIAADVLFFPTAMLGPLVERKLLTPLPAPWKAASTLAWDDFLELSRQRECSFGEQAWAAPLGSPGLVLMYRKDALAAAGLSVPKTWAEYQEAAAHFQKHPLPGGAEGKPAGSLEPLGSGWAGITLLARSAAYVRHPSHYSDLFDVESMRPLIDGPPFVLALEELVAASDTGPIDQREFDPVKVREAFLAGRGALAITWLPPSGPVSSTIPTDGCGFAELPGANKSFDLKDLKWQDRPALLSVPLLSVNGRLGAVLKSTPHEAAAFRLLAALTSADWGARISHASPQTGPSRRSQLSKPEDWLPRGIPLASATEYGAALGAAGARTQGMHALRIPGREKYLAALDQAVRDAVEGKVKPQEALSAAAKQWSEITAQLGRESQRKAYQRSLGLEP